MIKIFHFLAKILFILIFLKIIPTTISSDKNKLKLKFSKSAKKLSKNLKWTDPQICDKGDYIIGLSVQILAVKSGQNPSISGLKLLCGPPDTNRKVTGELGAFSKDGWWTRVYFCEGPSNGFQLQTTSRSSSSSNKGKKLPKLSNIKLFCNGFNETILPEVGRNGQIAQGYWTKPVKCKSGEALCTLKSKILAKDFEKPKDKDKIKNFEYTEAQMECCKILTPEESCIPEDKYEVLFEYDNSYGLHPATYSYAKRVGISKTVGSTTIRQNQKVKNANIKPGVSAYEKLGVEASSLQSLKANFETTLSTSKRTSFEWHEASSDTWQLERSTSIGIQVHPGYRLRVYQIVGFCGEFQVRTDWIYQNGTFMETRRRGIIDSNGQRRLRFAWKIAYSIISTSVLLAFNYFGQ